VFGLIGASPSEPFGASTADFFTVSLPGASSVGLAPDHRDLVLLEEIADAVVQSLDDTARTLHHGLQVERDFFPPTGRSPWRAASGGIPPPSAAAPLVGIHPQLLQMPPK